MKGNSKPNDSKSSVPLISGNSRALAAVGALSTGTLFGISLFKSQVFRPDIIQAQLTMQNFTMVKMFLSAALVSTVSIQWLAGRKLITISNPSTNLLKNIAGGALLGCGMYISGACPGTVLAQIGPGLKTAQLTLVGGIIGAFVYGLIEPIVSRAMPPPKQPSSMSVDSLLQTSRTKVTVAFTAALCGALVLLEYFRPWQVDVGLPLSFSFWDTLSLKAPLWPPYLGGAIIGLLQIPSYLMINHGLGCSSGYVSLWSNIFGDILTKKVEYFKSFYGTAISIWQLFLDVGVIVGSGIAFRYLNPGPSFTFSSSYPLLGGFLLILGARIANGCTSGHGLTGMGRLSFGSMVSVASMFGGGMLTAFLASKLF